MPFACLWVERERCPVGTCSFDAPAFTALRDASVTAKRAVLVLREFVYPLIPIDIIYLALLCHAARFLRLAATGAATAVACTSAGMSGASTAPAGCIAMSCSSTAACRRW